jgi:pseudaminic acid cytidylyltransferase
MKTVAIITARRHSKRIPGKNIRPFLGKPIIAYSIEAALSAGIFDEVMVSTDGEDIATIAKHYGAEVPFFRSHKNADDHATTSDVLLEVLDKYKEAGRDFQLACCLYPTAPFVTAEKLKTAMEHLQNSKADTVVPVTRFGFPIWRSFGMKDGKLVYNWPEFAATRSQDLPASYQDAGQFYFFRTEPFLASGKLITDNTLGLEIDESEVQDIDTEQDWKLAELKYSFKTNNKQTHP